MIYQKNITEIRQGETLMHLLPKHFFVRPTLHPLGFVGYVRSLVLRGAVVHVLILAITAASNWKKSPSTRSDLRRGEKSTRPDISPS